VLSRSGVCLRLRRRLPQRIDPVLFVHGGGGGGGGDGGGPVAALQQPQQEVLLEAGVPGPLLAPIYVINSISAAFI
jgi:hypothetical protein